MSGVHARVEYVKASDGVRIAYAMRGRGPAVIWMPPLPARHVELEWEQQGDRRWLEWLASRYTLVQYDPRGLGLSDRTVTSFSLDAFERDLHPVVERVARDGVILFAKVNAGALAISYAARHPELVSQLVLWCATPRFGEGIGSHLDGLVALAERDWDLFVQASAHLVRGWSAGEPAEQLATLMRAALSPERWRRASPAPAWSCSRARRWRSGPAG
jgi:pimeloyl-ACP methyl ester carboxylesterase